MSFEIAGRAVGGAARCLVVGEVAQAHDGSLGAAHAFVDAIADAGADAIKFQTHIAAAESTAAEPFRVHFSSQDATRYDYWKRMEFTEAQWQGLARHAQERGLLFLSSPFSIAAVDLLERVGMPAWKIASGEISNVPLFERVAACGRPVLLSTGMSPLAEVDAAVARAKAARLPHLVFQCTSAYPCPPEQLGLEWLGAFAERYACPVGLSDHSGGPFAGLAAALLGASMLEVHVALSRQAFGPDVPASLTPAELKQLCEGVAFLHRARMSRVDKDALAATMEPLRQIFFQGVVAAEPLAAGTVLERRHLAVKKPALGLPAERLAHAVGRRLAVARAADEPIRESDLEAGA